MIPRLSLYIVVLTFVLACTYGSSSSEDNSGEVADDRRPYLHNRFYTSVRREPCARDYSWSNHRRKRCATFSPVFLDLACRLSYLLGEGQRSFRERFCNDYHR